MSPRNPALAARNLGRKVARRAWALRRPAVHGLARVSRLREQFGFRTHEFQVEREIAAAARGDALIVAGPWLAEVGYEALYWIPFLRWFEDVYRVPPERVIAISRGGVGAWYAGVAGRYLDLFEVFTPEQFAERNAARRAADEAGGQKQSARGAFDTEILDRLRERIGLGTGGAMGGSRLNVFHPGLLFRLFKQFWLGNQSQDFLWQHMRFATIPPPARPALPLPADYIAVKFYAGVAMPPTEANRRAVRSLVSRLAASHPVVVLDSGIQVDEHEDYRFEGMPNVVSLRNDLPPVTNLQVQTEVIAGARHFVGTCGSVAWLAPLLGVPTLAVFADDRLLGTHLNVARHAYREAGAARFTTLDLRSAQALHLLDSAGNGAGNGAGDDAGDGAV